MLKNLVEEGLVTKVRKLFLIIVRRVLIKINTILEFFIFRISKEIAKEQLKNSKEPLGEIDKKFLQKTLNANPVIIEVGAHYGHDTLELSVLFPEARIYAFEPFLQNFIQLQKNCQHLKNVTAVCVALSNSIGVNIFHQSSGTSNASGSILLPTNHLQRHPTVFFDGEDKKEVITITLDTYFDSIDISKVDLIWIDVQGAERLVLEGGTELLKKTCYVYLEVSEVPLYEGAMAYSDMKLFMASRGFEVSQEFLPTEWNDEGNVLFRNISI